MNSLRIQPFLLALRRQRRFARRNICDSATEIPYLWHKICPESGQELWLVVIAVVLFDLLCTNDRQKTREATKVKCKCDESTVLSTTKQLIFVEYILLQKKASEFCCSSFAVFIYDMHDAWILPSSLFWKRSVCGCLPFTNIFREIRWKVNGTRIFGSSQRKTSGSNGTSEMVVLFFPMEYSKRKFVFHSFKAIFDTSYRPSRPFLGKWNWFAQMVKAIPGRNLPVLNFANHLPTPWTEWFAHVNGKQSESQVRHVLGEKAQQCTIMNFESLPWTCQTTESGVTREVVHTMVTLLGNMTVTHLLMWLFLSLRYHSSCLSDFPIE